MKQVFGMMILIALVVVFVTPLKAEERIAKRLAQSCKSDIKTYCKDVKPGKGRILACLDANSDKLSEQCAAVVKEADEGVKEMEDAMALLKEHCQDDFDKYCKDVVPGKGRVRKCIEDNEANLSPDCKNTLKEIKSKK